jgi:hypothetical protein
LFQRASMNYENFSRAVSGVLSHVRRRSGPKKSASSFGSRNIGVSILNPWFDVSTSTGSLDTIESSRLRESSASD